MVHAVQTRAGEQHDRDDALNVATVASRAAESVELVLAHADLDEVELGFLRRVLIELDAWKSYLNPSESLRGPSRRSLKSVGLVVGAVSAVGGGAALEGLETHRRTVQAVVDGNLPHEASLRSAREFFDELGDQALAQSSTSGERLTRSAR